MAPLFPTRPDISNYKIRPITEEHLEGFREAVDGVKSER